MDNLTESFLGQNGAEDQVDGGGSQNFDQLKHSLSRITNVWNNKQIPAKFLNMDVEGDTRAEWRKTLYEGLEHTYTHVFLVALLLVDLFATAVDILKTIHNKTNDLNACSSLVKVCACVEHFEETEGWEFVYWISICILTILAINVILLLVACGLGFFRHAGYVLDLVVVSIALALEVFLDTDTVGLLIVLTLWRIVRVAHGIFEVTDEAWEKEIKTFELKLEEAKANHERDQELIREKDERIAELESSM